MASSDVIKRTEELIKVLETLASTSELTGENVKKLEEIVQRLSGLTADSNMRSIVGVLNSFNKELSTLQASNSTIKQITTSFQALATTVKTLSPAGQERLGYLGKSGFATMKMNAAVASGDTYEARKQEELAAQYKTIAANMRKEISGTIPILQETFALANEAQLLQQSIMQRLITPSASIPLLPAVTETTLREQKVAAEREAYYTNSRRERMQRLTSAPIETPAQRMQRLTAGVSVAPPPPQAPGTIVSGVTGPTTPYTVLSQQIGSAAAALTPIASVVQQSVQQGAQAGLAAGLQAGAASAATGVGAGVQAGVQQGAQVGVQTGTTAGAQQGAAGVQQTVKQATQAGAQAGTAAGTAAGAQTGAGGQPFNVNQPPPPPVQTLAQKAAAAAPNTPSTYIPFNQALFQSMGLTDQAAATLETRLQKLGLTSGVLNRYTTELSTGIQTLTVSAFDEASQATKTFTAHLGPMGNLLEDTQKRFRGFGSAVMRDVVEVLKWTIAISAIYGPIRKMGEMLEEAKKIQLDMVDVQIVLGNSTREMNTVFEESSKIATQTSSSIEGVVEGYALAAAASSSAGGETARMITTQSLLKNSMMLSKIAGIDQKQAMDTLVGALSQLGMKLTDGTALLDSWVAVSKKANVSVKDMATSFTIVGSAAEEAGLSYNELNGLIGALAQSTNLSADELGNAIRGIIAAMQTDKAQTEFAKYGIATKTVAGDFRDFMEILKEMKVMSQTGILDEKAMGALTQAGGAGARRGAQLSALVQSLNVAMQLTTVSETASGDAAKAMALEMGTLDAATTRLNNAFTSLAVSLGGEGGVLGALTFVTNAVTFLITQMKGLVNIMRAAAPIMAAFILTKGVMGTSVGATLAAKQIPTFLSQLFTSAAFIGQTKGTSTVPGIPLAGKAPTGLFAGLTRRLQGTNVGSTITQSYDTSTGALLPIPIGRRASIREFAGGIGTRLSTPFLGQMNIASMLGPALIAASNIGKPMAEGIPRAGIGLISGAITAAITGSALWATVGSIIATGFYDKFLTFQGDIATGWSKFLATNPPKETDTGGSQSYEDLMAAMEAAVKPSLNFGEIVSSNLVAFGNNLLSSIGIGRQSTQGVGKLLTGQPGTGKEQVSQGDILLLMAKGMVSAGGLMDEETRKQIIDLYNRWLVEQTQQGLMGDIPMTKVQADVEKEVTNVAKYAATGAQDIMKQALEDITTGASTGVQNYINAQNAAQGLASTAAGLIVAQRGLGAPVAGITKGAELVEGYKPTPGAPEYTPLPGYQAMQPQQAVQFIAGLDTQQLSAVTSAYTEIKDALNGIEAINKQIAAQPGGATKDQAKMLKDYQAQLDRIATTFPQIMQAIQQASIVTKATAKLKDIITLPEMTPQKLQEVRLAAEKMWREYLEASGLTDAEIQAYMNAQNEKILKIGENIPGIKTKIPQEFYTQALTGLGITGQGTSIQEMTNVTSAQLTQALAQVPTFITALNQMLTANNMPLYQPNMQDLVAITSDKAVPIHTDMTILQLLLKDLIDVEEKKGLQGMYNLPEGAQFYVPVTAYEMSKATVTEMAEGGGSAGILQAILNLLQQYMPGIAEGITVERATPRPTPTEQYTGIMPTRTGITTPTEIPTETPVTPWLGMPAYSTPLQQQLQQFQQPIPPKNALSPLEQFMQNLYNFFNNLPKLPGSEIIEPKTQTSTPTTPLTLDQQMAPFLESNKMNATPAPTLSPIEQFLQNLYSFFDKWPKLPSLETTEPQGQGSLSTPTTVVTLPPAMTNWFSQQSMLTTPALATGATQAPDQRPISTALNLSVDSRIVLTVDGRTLATIIKPYLYEDLIRFGTTTTTSISKSVIA